MKIDALTPSYNSLEGSLSSGVHTKQEQDFQAILEKTRREKDDRRLMEACQDLEAVFVNQMLSRMRAAVQKGGLLPESSAERIYRSMLDEEYSKIIARSPQSLGLAEMLYRQLKQDQNMAAAQDETKK